MKGTVYKRCGCKDPDTDKPLNAKCPKLSGRRHGTWVLDTRIDTTSRDQRRLKRGGYESQTKANAALDAIGDLIKLAGGDDRMRRRIGDLIFERTKRGGQLPDAEEIRRRLGAGTDLAAPSVTVAEWLEEWYAGKRKLKRGTLELYRQHMDHYLIPLLGEIPRDNLRVEHIAGVFDTIDEWNAEIVAAKEEDRRPYLPDDKRKRPRVVGNTTQHRILDTLSTAYNAAVKRPGMINWNPCLAVELPPEVNEPGKAWTPEQVGIFLESSAEDRYALMYRIILLRGLRRGEACGIRIADLDDDGSGTQIVQTILSLSAGVVIDTPKSRSSGRHVSFDTETTVLVRAERLRRRREKLAAGDAYSDHGLLFCREDGTPLHPSSVSRYFRQLSDAAGLPRIRLHDARHTAATLMFEAGIDIKIVSENHGHSGTGITADIYTHVRRAVHDDAAEQVLKILPGRRKETGS